MRVIVATDSIAPLSSCRAGAVLAQGWPQAELTVVPVGEAGAGFLQSAADQRRAEVATGLLGDRVVSVVVADRELLVAVERTAQEQAVRVPVTASSVDLGRAVVHALNVFADSNRPPGRLLIDLGGLHVHDAGAGFLAALGAEADAPLEQGSGPLANLSRVDLAAVRERLAGVELVGVVPTGEEDAALLGLRGVTSRRAGSAGKDRSTLLATDAALARFAELVDPARVRTGGAGASGGLGFAVLALGGRLVTGPRLALADVAETARPGAVDLVVTGCTVLDFAHRGGGVVAEVARLAASLLCPCVAVAGRVLIGGRELRTMGIESAYAVTDAVTDAEPQRAREAVEEAHLLATAQRVGRSWRW